MGRKSTITEKTCPRCGTGYKYTEKRVINGQTYYYAIHIHRDETNRKKVRKCYLGAETYRYVKLVHNDSNLQFHGYAVENRYTEYMNDILDYLSRDSANRIIAQWRNKSRVQKKSVKTGVEIEPIVKEIFSKHKFKVPIIVLNSLYIKYKKYALDAGMTEEAYNEIFSSLDATLSKSEIEQYLSMNLSGDAFRNTF